MLSLSGMLMQRTENLRACIEELDGQTGQMINRLRLYEIPGTLVVGLDMKAYSVPLKRDIDAVKGKSGAAESYGSL